VNASGRLIILLAAVGCKPREAARECILNVPEKHCRLHGMRRIHEHRLTNSEVTRRREGPNAREDISLGSRSIEMPGMPGSLRESSRRKVRRANGLPVCRTREVSVAR